MQASQPSLGTKFIRAGVVALFYYLLGRFGLTMPYKLSVVTLLWLPIGIAVPAVYRWGWFTLWGVLVGEVAVTLSIAPMRWTLALALAGANIFGIIVVERLLRRFDFNPRFQRRRDVVVWCAASALGTLSAPILGPTFLCLAGYVPWSAWNQAWLMWWVSDLVGLLLAGPVLMAVTEEQLTQWHTRFFEVIALAGATALLGWVGFFRPWPAAFSQFHPFLLAVPLLVWAALRFGVVGASSLALGISIMAALAASLGMGTFASLEPGAAIFSLWAFAGMAALLSLLITALDAERNQSDEALRQQEQELRTLTDSLPDVIMRLDRDRRVVFVNKSIETATGIAVASFRGRTTVEAGLPLGTIPNWSETLGRVLATGRMESIEFEYAGPPGIRRWTAQMMPELDEQAVVRTVLIICRDITERNLLEKQLRQSQKLEAVGTLAGGIAHDFNNILTGIFGNTQMAMMDLPPDNPVQEWLRRVQLASQRAKALVNQLLTFSRRQDPQRVPLQLSTIVQEAMQLLRPSLPATIEIQTQLAANCPMVLADPSQLHQVLVNLVTNASHAIG
ncbi:MAG: MASE1 domain-containing protein, partial [Opitutales bacterium]